jgi:drug/metabolite transporter (DMT)-like permease
MKPKSEIRNSKPGRSPNSEFRRSKRRMACGLRPAASGFLSDFGLRILDSWFAFGEAVRLAHPTQNARQLVHAGSRLRHRLVWMDYQFLPRELRMRWPLLILSGVATVLFVVLGLKAYSDDQGGLAALFSFVGTLALGLIGAVLLRKRDGKA